MAETVIFGAGKLGGMAIRNKEKYKVVAVIDNDQNKIGTEFEGFRVISLQDFLKMRAGDEKVLICASWKHTCEMEKQLVSEGILDYSVFQCQLYENVDLIADCYRSVKDTSWESWNEGIIEGKCREYTRKFVNENKDDIPLFHEIEIETINRCNGNCSFCPVNVKNDTRVERRMDETLFYKIVDELREIHYAGRVALFSNNEPLLDDRILSFSKHLRNQLPKAQIHLFTNGTLLSIPFFMELIQYLDELIIDNYNRKPNLIPTVKRIKEYIENSQDEQLRKKVKIMLRNPDETLSTRGGDAPNRNMEQVLDVYEETCALPYCQMVVRPSGEVSLCCNDPYGKMTLGDLNQEHILDVWYGSKYKEVREKLIRGRRELEHCKRCDTFLIL